MTVQQLFEYALALMPTNTSEDTTNEQYAVMWANLLLVEALSAHNARLLARGEAALDDAPQVAGMADPLPYDQPVSMAMVWGMASFLAKDDDDVTHEQYFRAQYIAALAEATRAILTQIVDVYGRWA